MTWTHLVSTQKTAFGRFYHPAALTTVPPLVEDGSPSLLRCCSRSTRWSSILDSFCYIRWLKQVSLLDTECITCSTITFKATKTYCEGREGVGRKTHGSLGTMFSHYMLQCSYLLLLLHDYLQKQIPLQSQNCALYKHGRQIAEAHKLLTSWQEEILHPIHTALRHAYPIA